jgi:hypothetical protein
MSFDPADYSGNSVKIGLKEDRTVQAAPYKPIRSNEIDIQSVFSVPMKATISSSRVLSLRNLCGVSFLIFIQSII